MQTARALRALVSPFAFDSMQGESRMVWERPGCATPVWRHMPYWALPMSYSSRASPSKANRVNADYSSPTGTFLLSLVYAFRGCCSIPAWTRETRAQNWDDKSSDLCYKISKSCVIERRGNEASVGGFAS